MKFFVDTADVAEIRKLNDVGIVDGATTNPTLIAKSGRQIREVLAEICELVDGPVSGETVSTDAEGMVREGHWLREIADNLTVKVPLTVDGIKATKILSDEGIPVNVNLCFSSGPARSKGSCHLHQSICRTAGRYWTGGDAADSRHSLDL